MLGGNAAEGYVRREHGSGSSSAISSGSSSHGAARTNFCGNTLELCRSMLMVGIHELQGWSTEDVVLKDRELLLLDYYSNTAPHVPDVIAYLVRRERGGVRHPTRPVRSALDPADRVQLVQWLAKFNKYLDGTVGTLQAGVHLLDAATPLLPCEQPAALEVARYWLAAMQATERADLPSFQHFYKKHAWSAMLCSGAPPVLCGALDALCSAVLACAQRAGIPRAALAAAALLGTQHLRRKRIDNLNLQSTGDSDIAGAVIY